MASQQCEVLIVGGGPAGSACAWKLRQHGIDVLVTDAAVFPRPKVCAGWITQPVVDELQIDIEEYRKGRTLQPITSFVTSVVGDSRSTRTSYDRPVSFGIRRCEFDHFLLQRAGARLRLGTATKQIRRDGEGWVVDEAIRARMLIGAGGHFCPVARWLNQPVPDPPLVAAEEIEFEITREDSGRYPFSAGQPELYFCADFKGYGWCFRKQRYLNVGFGRLDPRSVAKGTAGFLAFLKAAGRLPSDASWRWKGHAYLVPDPLTRFVRDSAVLLVGDAAGLANPQSGEGIRPAIESGLLAASTIVDAGGQYSGDRLMRYERELRRRFYPSRWSNLVSDQLPSQLTSALGRRLLRWPWFVRHGILNRWFVPDTSSCSSIP